MFVTPATQPHTYGLERVQQQQQQAACIESWLHIDKRKTFFFVCVRTDGTERYVACSAGFATLAGASDVHMLLGLTGLRTCLELPLQKSFCCLPHCPVASLCSMWEPALGTVLQPPVTFPWLPVGK